MTTMLFVRRAAILAALLVPVAVSANPQHDADKSKDKPAQTEAKLSDADLHVLTDLHATNQMEIDAGKLAKTRGKSKAVKDYGQMLAADHKKANKDVLALAKARGATLADHPTPRDETERAQMEKDMAAMERLKTLEGATFDREFLAAMVDGHARAISKVETATGMVSDAKLKTLLVKVKPVLQKHHDRAKALQTPPTTSAR